MTYNVFGGMLSLTQSINSMHLTLLQHAIVRAILSVCHILMFGPDE